MKSLKWMVIAACFLFCISALAQVSTVYTLRPTPLTNGWAVTGTITTDGTVGKLSAANLVDWDLKVVQTTDFVWTEKDSSNLNISKVYTDGKKIYVATSPDGYQDGGNLTFARGGGGGRIATSAVIADFTQLSMNLGYVGGMAGWQDEIWGLNFVGLNQRNKTMYRAAVGVKGQPNVFAVTVPVISMDPLLITVFGTLTTDGTVGALLPQNILSWNITARNQDITHYTKANSGVLTMDGVASNGTFIGVAHKQGKFTIGIGGMRPTYVTIADFTDPTYPDGYANYYRGNYGIMGEKFPLVNPTDKYYIAGKK